MNWTDYKTACERPDCFSRHALEITIAALEGADAVRIASFLERTPIEKPADHRGGAETDFFPVAMEPGLVERVIAVLRGVARSGGPRAGRYAHLAVVWSEYLDTLDRPEV